MDGFKIGRSKKEMAAEQSDLNNSIEENSFKTHLTNDSTLAVLLLENATEREKWILANKAS